MLNCRVIGTIVQRMVWRPRRSHESPRQVEPSMKMVILLRLIAHWMWIPRKDKVCDGGPVVAQAGVAGSVVASAGFVASSTRRRLDITPASLPSAAASERLAGGNEDEAGGAAPWPGSPVRWRFSGEPSAASSEAASGWRSACAGTPPTRTS